METTLKITNVLSDPTRFYIYQYITKKHDDVTVHEIAEEFSIHPNVARLHLTKLEDVRMLISNTKKSGKGGRPSRFYRLSQELVQLNFPYRDYQLLSKIALKTLMGLGEVGVQALYETGKEFGTTMMQQQLSSHYYQEGKLNFEQKLALLKNSAITAGFHPEFEVSNDKSTISFQVYNCPFKEMAMTNPEVVCAMHVSFLRGMFESLFENVNLIEGEKIIDGCHSCTYQANV